MAIGLSKELTKIGIMEETTEGTWLAPAADTDYVQPLDGGYSLSGSKEEKERNILTSGFTAARTRVGIKSEEFQLNVEAKASGTEGGKPESDLLFKNLLGLSRQISSRQTSGTTHTTTVINFASTAAFNVGDIVVVLEDDDHHISPIVTVTTNTSITLLVPAGSAFSDNVEVAKLTTYYSSNTQSDFKSLSLSFYHGNEILEKGIGVRPNNFSLSNFTTSEIASFDFSGDGLSFDRINGAAPHTPNYDDATPPLILGACVYKDGVRVDVNNLSLTIDHANGFITSTCSPDGRLSARKTGKRNITGSFNPYMDDTDVSLYDAFKNNTSFSIFLFAANPSTTAGEYNLGSIWGVYMPACISTANVAGDQEGIITEEVEFRADGGQSGEDAEIFISFC